MFSHMAGAFTRAVLVAIMVATPSLLLPHTHADTSQVAALIALFAAALTMSEYAARYPSLIEFRDAPPYNRIRFIVLLLTIFVLSIMARNVPDPSGLTIFFEAIGLVLGHLLDFPYSPVRLVLQSLPAGLPATYIQEIRDAASVAYTIGLFALLIFYLLLRIFDWPTSTGAFNVWVNLPTFDPTAGGDVVARLKRDARVNLALGFLLPFLIPAVANAATMLFGPILIGAPQTLVWTVAAWAFMPFSLFMRGIAMNRVANMIDNMRRRNVPAEGAVVFAA